MKIAVLGQSVEDHLIQDTIHVVQPGGIHYSAAALASVASPEDELFLISSYEDRNYYLFEKTYSKFNLQFSIKVDAIPRVDLKVLGAQNRHEHFSHITQKLQIEHIPFNMFDGIYINMVTGFDISLDDLIFIRKQTDVPVYLDVHTFSRGLESNGDRRHRVIPEFFQWAACLNFIQVNDIELFCLLDNKDELSIIDAIIKIPNTNFNDANRGLIITRAAAGAELYTRKEGNIQVTKQPAIPIESKHPIGCGDSFGALFLYHVLKTGCHSEALRYAVTGASCVAEYTDPEQIAQLHNDIALRFNS